MLTIRQNLYQSYPKVKLQTKAKLLIMLLLNRTFCSKSRLFLYQTLNHEFTAIGTC